MEIRPFRGWRYGTTDGDVSTLIAPPYDVLTAADKQALLKGSEDNIVAADLPHVPPKEAGPDEVYARAAQLLARWQKAGTLVQDDQPALYAYEQTFSWAGKTLTRRALLCGLRATPFGADVIPHEHTFAGPKADRMKLTQATRMQLSPIFGFFDDPGLAVTESLFAGLCCPKNFGMLGGVQERLWVVDDPGRIRTLASQLRRVPVFIADGHHRYTTALAYRDALAAKGAIGPEHEANFVLFALVAKQEAGLKILPTHRIIRGLNAKFSLDLLRQSAGEFDWQYLDLSRADLSDADAFLGRFGPTAMAFVDARSGKACVSRLARPEAMVQACPDKLDAWRRLDVAILHSLIVDRHLKPWHGPQFGIEYTPRAQDVLAACRQSAGETDCTLGVCLQSTPLDAVEQIAKAGEVMPHKSTYFYPKLATGLVLKPLE